MEPPLDTRELSSASAHAIVKHTRAPSLPPSLPNSWFDRVFSSSMASHPANFAGTTPVSRRPSLHTSRVSAGRKRNEKVERANPGNRVTHRQKSRRKKERGEEGRGIATAMCPMRSDSPFSKRIRRAVIRNCLGIFHSCWIECS